MPRPTPQSLGSGLSLRLPCSDDFPTQSSTNQLASPLPASRASTGSSHPLTPLQPPCCWREARVLTHTRVPGTPETESLKQDGTGAAPAVPRYRGSGKHPFGTSRWPEESPCAHRTRDKHEGRTSRQRRGLLARCRRRLLCAAEGTLYPRDARCVPAGAAACLEVPIRRAGRFRCLATTAGRGGGMRGELRERGRAALRPLNKAAVTSTRALGLSFPRRCGGADPLLCVPEAVLPEAVLPEAVLPEAVPWAHPGAVPVPVPGTRRGGSRVPRGPRAAHVSGPGEGGRTTAPGTPRAAAHA
ncbi:uncharacterized protein LOC120410747 [Corvus cornix cornix]|uniref:uncharacterized protein LOC120410747 n=1 Tax=Corvus cornix cornix TaxID=932674 RepID=UPI0019527EA2|nr:uncharacterized protein LOC120410747 [Corvus cornix cornix]